jgi:hypothetical protein
MSSSGNELEAGSDTTASNATTQDDHRRVGDHELHDVGCSDPDGPDVKVAEELEGLVEVVLDALGEEDVGPSGLLGEGSHPCPALAGHRRSAMVPFAPCSIAFGSAGSSAGG